MNYGNSKEVKEVERPFSTSDAKDENGIASRFSVLRSGLTEVAFANKCGIAVSTLRRYLDGSVPGADKAAHIADVCGVSLEWLITGRGHMTPGDVNKSEPGDKSGDDFALVPRYDVTASAGHGAIVESEQIVDHLAFRRSWLAQERLQEGKLALIQARGDSMQPTIMSGDLLLVDLREQQATGEGVFVLQIGVDLVAKRIQRLFDGSIYIKSDNPAYDPQQLAPDQIDRLHVIGRVVWVARRI